MKQTCILILGMHRSGTSALTGILSELDISLGEDLIKSAPDNQKGFFENEKFLQFNKIFLRDYHTPLEAPNFCLKIKKEKEKVEILKQMISDIFEYDKIFAIKDPRITYLFPLYKKALNELNINIVVIIPIRNPVDVAKSLKKRNSFSMDKSFLMWADHILESEKQTRNNKRVFTYFDELMANPKKVVKKISNLTDIDLNKKFLKNKNKINDFLEPNLKHHNTSLDNISNNIPIIVNQILNLKDKFNDSSTEIEFDKIRNELSSYKNLFYNQEVIDALDELQKIKQVLEQNRKTLNEKEQILVQKNRELTQTKESLTQVQENAKKIKQALEQNRKTLTEKEQILVQRNREFTQTKESLTQVQDNAEKIKQVLEQNRKTLTEKEQTIVQKDKALSQTQKSLTQTQDNAEKIKHALEQKSKELIHTQKSLHGNTQVLKNTELELAEALKQIEELKDEIVVIYTERGCEITRFLKKIKKAF